MRAIGSLRLRLLVTTSVAVAVVLCLLGIGIYFSMRSSLLTEFDANLLSEAQALAAMAEQGGGRVKYESDAQEMSGFSPGHRPQYFQVWLDDGQVLARSASLNNGDLRTTPPPASLNYADMILPDHHHGRALTFPFTPRIDHDEDIPGVPTVSRHCVVMIAKPIWPLNETLETLRGWLIALCGSAIGVSGTVLLIVAGRAVAPIKELSRQIEQLKETQLSQRLNVGQVPTELHPVVEKVNGLLARLEQIVDREKAFTADVAHELRTPLAGLLAVLEVCVSQRREPVAYERAMTQCIQIIQRMESMVSNLLLLARADSASAQVSIDSIPLQEFIQQCWEPFAARAAERELTCSFDIDADVLIKTDREKLRIVIHNLLDNAVNYANACGFVQISSRYTAGRLALMIANSGCRLTDEQVKRVFDRFWRGDVSRSETGVHCGLGLPLCRRIMEMLGGSITATIESGGLFKVVVELPSASRESQPDESRLHALQVQS